MTFTGRDSERFSPSPPFSSLFLFSSRVQGVSRGTARDQRPGRVEGGEAGGETGRKATGEKVPRFLRTRPLHLLLTIMHALGVFRARSAPQDRNQVKMDCSVALVGLAILRIPYDDEYTFSHHLFAFRRRE